MDTSPKKRLSNAYIHLNEAIITDIAMGGGGWMVLRIIIDIRRGYDWYVNPSYATHKRLHCITQQSNRVGVQFLCGDDGVE